MKVISMFSISEDEMVVSSRGVGEVELLQWVFKCVFIFKTVHRTLRKCCCFLKVGEMSLFGLL